MKTNLKKFVMLMIIIITNVAFTACTEDATADAKGGTTEPTGKTTVNYNVLINGGGSSYTSKTTITVICPDGTTTPFVIDTHAKGAINTPDTVWAQERNIPAFVLANPENAVVNGGTTTYSDKWACGQLFDIALDFNKIKQLITACKEDFELEVTTGFYESKMPTYTREYKGKVVKGGYTWVVEEYTYSVIIKHVVINNEAYEVILTFTNLVAIPEGKYIEDKDETKGLELKSLDLYCDENATATATRFFDLNDLSKKEEFTFQLDSVVFEMVLDEVPGNQMIVSDLNFMPVVVYNEGTPTTIKTRVVEQAKYSVVYTYKKQRIMALAANGTQRTGYMVYTFITYTENGITMEVTNLPATAKVTDVTTPSASTGENAIGTITYLKYSSTWTYKAEFKGHELSNNVCDIVLKETWTALQKKEEDKTWEWVNMDKGLTWVNWSYNTSWEEWVKTYSDNTKETPVKYSGKVNLSTTLPNDVIVDVTTLPTVFTLKITEWGATAGQTRNESQYITAQEFNGRCEVSLNNNSANIIHMFEKLTLTAPDIPAHLMPWDFFKYEVIGYEAPVKLADENGKERILIKANIKQSYNENSRSVSINYIFRAPIDNPNIDKNLNKNAGGSTTVCDRGNLYKTFGVVFTDKEDEANNGVALFLDSNRKATSKWSKSELEWDRLIAGLNEGKKLVFLTGSETGDKLTPCFFTPVKAGDATNNYYFSLLKGASEDQAIGRRKSTEWNVNGVWHSMICNTTQIDITADNATFIYEYEVAGSKKTESITTPATWGGVELVR